MRISIVTETFVPSVDGVVTRLKEAVKYLKGQGHQLEVIAPDLGVDEYLGVPIRGTETIVYPFYKQRPWGRPTDKVIEYLEDFKPDIVHCANPLLIGYSGVRSARKLDIPLICSYHTHIPKYLDHYRATSIFKPLVWWYIRYIHNKADINLCTSETIKRELEEHGIKNVHVLIKGVDTEMRNPKWKSEETRSYLTGGHEDRTLLLFVGRLANEKEIERLRPLMDLRDDIQLVLVGDGPDKEALEKLFKGTNTLFTGFKEGEELSRIYASADCFIFPSVTETLGLVITEAMASGLPVLAAKSGPTMEQIEDEKTGLLFDADSPESISHQLDRLKDKDLNERLRKNARKEAEKYSWERASQDLYSYYQETLRLRGKI